MIPRMRVTELRRQIGLIKFKISQFENHHDVQHNRV